MIDAHMISQILALALAGGLIGLDRTAAGQFMLSQPIVAGPVAGWMLGDAAAGLTIGAVLELIWVMDLPVGTFVPANATLLTLWATGSAILGSGGAVTAPVAGFCILLSAALVHLTMTVDGVVRKLNGRLGERVETAPPDQLRRALVRAQYSGLALFFLKYVAFTLVLLPPGIALVHGFARLPAPYHAAMGLYVTLLLPVGVASVVRKLSIKRVDGFLLLGVGVAAAAALLALLPPLLIPFLAAGAGWAGIRYQERGMGRPVP